MLRRHPFADQLFGSQSELLLLALAVGVLQHRGEQLQGISLRARAAPAARRQGVEFGPRPAFATFVGEGAPLDLAFDRRRVEEARIAVRRASLGTRGSARARGTSRRR